jgi:hypothetical protein
MFLSLKYIIIFFFVLIVITIRVTGQEVYCVEFADKIGNGYSVSNPEEFLSARAIERRNNQGIVIDEHDLPVSTVYLDSLKSFGLEVLHTSKWFNRATVVAQNSDDTLGISEWSFVKDITLTKPALLLKHIFNKSKEQFEKSEGLVSDNYYGAAKEQLFQLNGQYLHQNGFRGEGMIIAVIDGGFYGVNELSAFDSLWINNKIIGTRDFVNPDSDIFLEDNHGMNVLSEMGAVLPGDFVGVAPDASYLLLRSEDGDSEYPVEMDNWIAAIEFADSAGADVVNSSLGYFFFDETFEDLSILDLDGKTIPISKAAQMAVDKGMVVCISAGNEGNKEWRKIIAPSDGEDVLSVAAVDVLWQLAPFSSVGPSADGRVKPDVAACGMGTNLIWTDNSVYSANGTSFASPLIAGLAACLWQASPDLSSKEIIGIIRMCSSQADTPDSFIGYGIPDFQKALGFVGHSNVNKVSVVNNWNIYPNPFRDVLNMRSINNHNKEEVIIKLYNNLGVLVWGAQIGDRDEIVQNFTGLPTGVYYVEISGSGQSEVHKMLKE